MNKSITFESKKVELQKMLNDMINNNDIDGAQSIFQKIQKLNEHRNRLKDLLFMKDEEYEEGILMTDPVYQEAIASHNVEIIEAFRKRTLTEEKYRKLIEQQYERLFDIQPVLNEKNLNEKDVYEKKQIVENILTMVNIIYKKYGEERGDMLVMQISDFLLSSQGIAEFDLMFLQKILNKVNRYNKLLEKIINNNLRLYAKKQKEKEIKKQEIIANKMREIQEKEDELNRELNEIYNQLVEKQKVLYQIIEDILKNSTNSTYVRSIYLTSDIPSLYQLDIFHPYVNGLPSLLPKKFVKYIKYEGKPITLKLLKKSNEIVKEIGELHKKLFQKYETYRVFMNTHYSDEEKNIYYADSSEVFIGEYIPVPINKLAWKGMAEKWYNHGNKYEDGYEYEYEYEDGYEYEYEYEDEDE